MTTSMYNGIFLRDNTYTITSNIDSAHLSTLMKNAPAVDLGVVDMFAFAKKREAPLYTFASFDKKNIIYVNHPKGEFKWSVPIATDLPFVVEDLDPFNTNKGAGGTPFKIKFNKRAFSHNEIITYDKFNGLEFVITDDDIIPVSDGFIYTVRPLNITPINNQYLANGVKWFVVGSIKGEFTDRYPEIYAETGYREYYNYLSTAEASVHFSISDRAKGIIDGLFTEDNRVNVVEIWRIFDNNIDPSIVDLNSLIEKKGIDYVKSLKAAGKIGKAFVTKLEAVGISKILRDIDNQLMWGKGGRYVQNTGADDIRMSVGLWKQLDRGYKHVYTKDSFTLDYFRSEIFNYFAGKVDFKGPDPERKLIVHTGMGGFTLVQNAIASKVVASGLQVQAAANAGIGAISGTPMSLHFGYAYSGITFPFLANVTFVINPSLDNYNTNDIENPIIDGFPLSSYSFIIYDVTNNTNDNIYMLKWANDHELKWFYQNGTMDYLGRKTGFQSSGNFSGFRVFMSQRYPGIWVKDPTRIMKIVMKNPITNGSL